MTSQKMVSAASPKRSEVKPSRAPNAQLKKKLSFMSLFRRGLKKLNNWNLGLSGKVILVLVIIGLIAKIIQKLF